MRIKLYSQEGKFKSEIEAPASVFEVPMNRDLLHQAVRILEIRKRRVLAHTKTRGEVSGGGRKPWRQKGTGRARHGSIRSPLWKGGGVVFGPRKDRVYAAVLPKKMKAKAMRIALSAKAREGEVFALESFTLSEPKTKHAARLLTKVFAAHASEVAPHSRTGVLVVSSGDPHVERAVRNLRAFNVISADHLNLFDVLSRKFIVVLPGSLEALVKRFKGN